MVRRQPRPYVRVTIYVRVCYYSRLNASPYIPRQSLVNRSRRRGRLPALPVRGACADLSDQIVLMKALRDRRDSPVAIVSPHSVAERRITQ